MPSLQTSMTTSLREILDVMEEHIVLTSATEGTKPVHGDCNIPTYNDFKLEDDLPASIERAFCPNEGSWKGPLIPSVPALQDLWSFVYWAWKEPAAATSKKRVETEFIRVVRRFLAQHHNVVAEMRNEPREMSKRVDEEKPTPQEQNLQEPQTPQKHISQEHLKKADVTVQHAIINNNNPQEAKIGNDHLKPVNSVFAPELGVEQERLKSSSGWVVARFQHPDPKVGTAMVVKASSKGVSSTRRHHQELLMHRLIRKGSERKPAPPSLCKLVWELKHRPTNVNPSDLAEVQFGIAPVGIPISLRVFQTSTQFTNAISALLDALGWLHSETGIIHRDVRTQNVVVMPDTLLPVLIDFDCAEYVSKDPKIRGDPTRNLPRLWAGAVTCLPPRVLQQALETQQDVWTIEYWPEPQDDYIAVVLFVLDLMFPFQFKQFYTKGVEVHKSQAHLRALAALHKRLGSSPAWGHFWKSAQAGKIEGLRNLGRMVEWVEKPEMDQPGS